jgi:acetyl-CoA decarbonylase/synthase complex subunit delta
MSEALSLKEKWYQSVHEVCLGAMPQEGGTRQFVIRIGAQAAGPFLSQDGLLPNRPVIAAEVFDAIDAEESETLKQDLGSMVKDPAEWASFMIREAGADLACLKLQSIHPDAKNASADQALATTKKVLGAIKAPLVICGCGQADKDNEVLPVISEATKGEKLLFGDVAQENYKTITAACMADGHSVIAESPIDVNIAKQLNILLSDLGLPLNRIVINPTIGALGYGLEYAYSIMERARHAALSGDKMLAMPCICFVGQEVWRTKEARVSREESPSWGEAAERGVMWEVLTAMAMLQAGADILTMRHPRAIKIVRQAIDELTRG